MKNKCKFSLSALLLVALLTLSCNDKIDITPPDPNSPQEDIVPEASTGEYTYVEEATYNNGGLVINEFASQEDFIELYNSGTQTIDLSGFKLSDDKGLDRSDIYVFPQGANIEASGYYILVQNDEAQDGSDEFTFGLGSSDEVYLFDAADNIVDHISLPDNNTYAFHVDGRSYGRKSDGGSGLVVFMEATPGAENIATSEVFGDGGLYPDWTTETHSENTDPEHDIVFEQGKVLRLDINISSENWSAMRADLSDNHRNIMSDYIDYTPIWAPCTVTFEGMDWYQVGIRFKGNSSLEGAYSQGVYKTSLKLDFDEYEDHFPTLKNQRFYGFKQLNLNNNYEDDSFMREKTASDLFREYGIEAAHTAFYEVYINTGSGAQYFGLYTMVEEVDDTVIETQIEAGGNLYKPEDDAASFSSGSYDEGEFNLKTNEETCDYSDVLALYNALHSSKRTTDIEAWKSGLESVFDVDRFMKWLAVTATIQNWDSYGNMTQNYYLYNNPVTSLLTWIPWDHNEAFVSGKGNHSALGPNYNSVSSSWPLISYLIAVDEYEQIYEEYLQDFIEDVFSVDKVQDTYQSHYELIKESVYKEERNYTFLSSDYAFDSAVLTLKNHVQSRNTTINNYLK